MVQFSSRNNILYQSINSSNSFNVDNKIYTNNQNNNSFIVNSPIRYYLKLEKPKDNTFIAVDRAMNPLKSPREVTLSTTLNTLHRSFISYDENDSEFGKLYNKPKKFRNKEKKKKKGLLQRNKDE